MIKVHVRRTFGAVLVLAGAAVGCAVDAGDAGPGEAASLPGEDGFEFAPDVAPTSDKDAESADLSAKGSENRPFGRTFTVGVTIAPGQTVSYSTSGGSNSNDPVLVLFRRHDNSTNFGSPWTQRPGLQTLAINDDTNFRDAFISYTNNSGITENARLMVFAYGGNVGDVTLSGHGVVTTRAGSIKAQGTAGVAWTSGSSGALDPWLFMFDAVPGEGNGAWNDDDPAGGYESKISNATSALMWYVVHGHQDNLSSTTINF
jgi:hypothetical protein